MFDSAIKKIIILACFFYMSNVNGIFQGHTQQGFAILIDSSSQELLKDRDPGAIAKTLWHLLNYQNIPKYKKRSDYKRVPIVTSLSVLFLVYETRNIEKDKWKAYHLWRNEQGTWKRTQLAFMFHVDDEEYVKKIFNMSGKHLGDKEIPLNNQTKFRTFIKEQAEKFRQDYVNDFKAFIAANNSESCASVLKEIKEYINYLLGKREKPVLTCSKKEILERYFLNQFIVLCFCFPEQATWSKVENEIQKQGNALTLNTVDVTGFKYAPRIKKDDFVHLFYKEKLKIKKGQKTQKEKEEVNVPVVLTTTLTGHGGDALLNIKRDFLSCSVQSKFPMVAGILIPDVQDLLDFFNVLYYPTNIFVISTCYGPAYVDQLKSFYRRRVEQAKSSQKKRRQLRKFFRSLHYPLVVEGISAEPIKKSSDDAREFFSRAFKGGTVEEILHDITFFGGTTEWYQAVPQVLFPRTHDFLPIIISQNLKSIGAVLLRVHREESRKPIILKNKTAKFEIKTVKDNKTGVDKIKAVKTGTESFNILLTLLYQSLIDVPIEVFPLDIQTLDETVAVGVTKETKSIGGIKTTLTTTHVREGLRPIIKKFYGELEKYFSVDGDTSYIFPLIFPMKSGDSVYQFFSEIKVKDKEVLRFLRDAFFYFSESNPKTVTLLIDKLSGVSGKLHELIGGDKNSVVNLKKIRIKVWSEPVSGYANIRRAKRTLQFIVDNAAGGAYELQEREWKPTGKIGDVTQWDVTGKVWNFKQITNKNQYEAEYKNDVGQALKQAGRREDVDTFLSQVHKKEKGKLVSLLEKQKAGFPQFIRNLISRIRTLISKLDQKEQTKFALKLQQYKSRLVTIEKKTDNKFSVDDKIELDKIRGEIAKMKKEKLEKKGPLTKKVDEAVTSLDDLRKSLGELSSILKNTGGVLVKH